MDPTSENYLIETAKTQLVLGGTIEGYSQGGTDAYIAAYVAARVTNIVWFWGMARFWPREPCDIELAAGRFDFTIFRERELREFLNYPNGKTRFSLFSSNPEKPFSFGKITRDNQTPIESYNLELADYLAMLQLSLGNEHAACKERKTKVLIALMYSRLEKTRREMRKTAVASIRQLVA